jgi:hypothetical protein
VQELSRRQFARVLAGSAAVFVWDAFNADPDWHALREAGPLRVKEISLYSLAR